MRRYLSSHNMGCMPHQGPRELVDRLRSAKEVEFLQVLANMTDGQFICEFEATFRQAIEAWLQQSGIHSEWLRRIDFEATRDAFHDFQPATRVPSAGRLTRPCPPDMLGHTW